MTAKRKCINASSLQIRAARAIVDISRDHLAVKAGVNERAVRSAERIGCERRTVAREKIIKALARLGCDPCAIIIGAVEPVTLPPAPARPKQADRPIPAPVKKPSHAKVALQIAVRAPRRKLETNALAKTALAPQPLKAKPVAALPPAPIANWNDDRAKIAKAVEDARQKWSARQGPKADAVLEYLRLVEIGAAPWNARRV
jgi:hypothetical protein